MWSRCWWATWLSGGFASVGAILTLLGLLRVPLTVGTRRVPPEASLVLVVGALAASIGLLAFEAWKASRRAKSSAASSGASDV